MSNLLTASSQLPLYGKRVLVTAPRNYAARLSEQIISQGGLSIFMPTIETCYLSNYSELDGVIRRIDEFDWIAFTSRNGIIAFFERLHNLDIEISKLQNCQLSALGKDVDILLSLCGRVDLIPRESSPAGIVAEFSQIEGISGQKILVPIPEVVGISEPNIVPNFIADLKKLGMQVMRVPAYITQCLDKNIYTVEINLIRQGLIDIIAFSSTAEVASFLTMFDSKSEFERCLIACFGPYTAANAQELGVNVSIVSTAEMLKADTKLYILS
ncbi:uroporphyrinogen-III synthase [Anabaena subtropica]|uniref:Uroporphyrinogen-III synthase n=1 Tax=Anabaena subtropica FACHB-260 TaxID=2692884 RepID=A0ABR8CT11_9NOST|nr:uroporphyrinogen-III synthase [Anabaena subtropica]MBD2346327.1 uroporphyrinogen-III synthase [Anabaena subtropica FACHB-260]